MPSFSSTEDRKSVIRLLMLWLGLFVLAHGVAAFSSTLYAETQREQRIPLWPPSKPLTAWFERVWFAPFQRWDVNYYMRIAGQGYSAEDGTAQFHPLFPLAAHFFTALGVPTLLSLSVVAFIASAVLIGVLYVWARLDVGPTTAWNDILLFITSPFAFVIVIPYSEPLFLVMTGLCFILIRKRQWLWASFVGALATLTRQQGLLLIAPLIVGLIQDYDAHVRKILKSWGAWMSLVLIPLAYVGWVAYRAIALQDLVPDFTTPVDFIYSVLISPSAAKVVPQQTFMLPWNAFVLAVKKTLVSPDLDILINLGLAMFFLLFTGISWRKMTLESKAFTVVILLLSFSYSTGPAHPYMGLPRHLVLALPVFVALGRSVTALKWRLLLTAIGIMLQMFLVMAFVLRIWIP
jgi:hypothetical protein